MSWIPLIGTALSIFGGMNQASNQSAAASQEAQAAQQAAQGQTQVDQAITDVINTLLADYTQNIAPLSPLVSGQYQQEAKNIPASQITQYDLLKLLNPVDMYSTEAQQMQQSAQQTLQQTIANLAQNPDLVGRLTGISQNLGEAMFPSLLGNLQNLSIQNQLQYLNQLNTAQSTANQALGTAAQYEQAGKSILPGQEAALSNLAGSYAQSGSAAEQAWSQLMGAPSPYSSVGQSISNAYSMYPGAYANPGAYQAPSGPGMVTIPAAGLSHVPPQSLGIYPS